MSHKNSELLAETLVLASFPDSTPVYWNETISFLIYIPVMETSDLLDLPLQYTIGTAGFSLW